MMETAVKLLMRHEAAKIRAGMNGHPAPVRLAAQPAQESGDSIGEKMKFWRGR